MGIATAPYDDTQAMAVFRQLDPYDWIEAGLVRGVQITHLGLFADWRAMQIGAVLSLILRSEPGLHGAPFAVLALGNTGQAGVAQAALLARDHGKFRASLARACVTIRQQMPEFCAKLGIHRVEARCWAAHPTAARFLIGCGFRYETDLPGFGRDGTDTFKQFAWITPNNTGDLPCV